MAYLANNEGSICSKVARRMLDKPLAKNSLAA